MKKTRLSLLFSLLFTIAACGGGTALVAPTILSSTVTSLRLYPTSPISVTFSTAMNQASVESALQISDGTAVTGTYTWDGNTVTFRPAALWKTHHAYTLTIATTALDAAGTALETAYTQTFRTNINMHDVNGDGIDDIVASAPKNSESGLETGMIYLFLGRTSWSNIDLSTQTASAQYNVSGAGTNIRLGIMYNVVGDLNGDGYADIVAAAPSADLSGTDRGLAIIIYGSANPVSRTYAAGETDADILIGHADDVVMGYGVYPAGDVNGDGLADFLVGGHLTATDFQFWLVLGKTTAYGYMQPITSIASATYTVAGQYDFGVQMYHACDVNGDELDDIVVAEPMAAGGGTNRGQYYYVPGSTTPTTIDLRTTPASATFTGAADNDRLGFSIVGSCDDINADRYDDLIMCSPYAGGGKGMCYLVLGSASPASLNFATQNPSAIFTGVAVSGMGLTTMAPGDVNDDGYPDIVLGSPILTVSGLPNTGEAWLFLGSAAPTSVDLSAGGTAAATYVGERPPAGESSVLGMVKPFGDVNGDGIDDLVLNAPGSPDGTERGALYIVFGSATPASLDFDTQTANVTILGHADEDLLSVNPL